MGTGLNCVALAADPTLSDGDRDEAMGHGQCFIWLENIGFGAHDVDAHAGQVDELGDVDVAGDGDERVGVGA